MLKLLKLECNVKFRKLVFNLTNKNALIKLSALPFTRLKSGIRYLNAVIQYWLQPQMPFASY